MREEKVRFENAEGLDLAGVMELPDKGKPRATVLFAHCFTCTKNIKAAVNIARSLVENGFGVLRFDFTGLGESEGEFAATNFSSNVADLVAAARYLEEEWAPPSILVGHSLGGAAIIQAAHEVDSCRAVATIAAPADPAHVTHLFDRKRDEIEKDGEAEVQLAGRPFRIRKQLIDDLESATWQEKVRRLRRPLLLFHSPLDETVSISNAQEIFEEALHPKSFVSLDEADHLLSNNADSRYVGSVLAAWASKYLDPAEEEGSGENFDEPVIAELGREGLTTSVTAGRFSLVADEPRKLGGAEHGPSPYGFLSVALATCTAMTVQMYARHKKLSLENVRVEVTHDKVHARDCENCETKEGKVDQFTRRLTVSGDLDDEARERLVEIADRCPVHRSLNSEVDIVTTLD
ncbi:MAG: bifunctional alpha/beta hydrolase/OsmC family protein [Gammaproteobacteria bacterium]|nr:bifunctional alpha/beta hydrolase/OsmC family protein [Gammaproteobacteria bacterium]